MPSLWTAVLLTVAVLDGAGRPVPDAYVAIAKEGAPWSMPDAETIAPAGVAKLDAPPGRYRILAGARGYQTQYDRVTEIPSPERITITLERLGSAAGRVHTPDGKPVANARVGLFHEFVSDQPRALSERGKAQLGSNIVRSDADGLFDLPLPLHQSSVVVIEADGMAPVVVPNVGSGSPSLADIELRRGASLHARWNDDVKFEASDRIGIIPVEAQLPPSLPAHRAASMWRRLPGEASWNSLPAGTYDVVLMRGAAARPEVLQRITLSPGDAKRIELQQVFRADEGTRRLMLQGTDDAKSWAIIRWRSGRPMTIDAPVVRTGDGVEARINGDCVAGDQLVVSNESRIGAITDDCLAPSQAVSLRRRAELRVSVSVPRGAPEPAAGVIEAHDCTTNFTLLMEFAFRSRTAVVPFVAGCSAATMRIRGFTPVAMGRLQLAAAERRDLPVYSLEAARVILARVTAPDATLARDADVRVIRARDLATARTLETLKALPAVASARTDADGWTRLGELPDESLVIVTSIASQSLPHLSGPYQIFAGEERIEEIVVQRSARVTLSLDRGEEKLPLFASSATLVPEEGGLWPQTLELQARFQEDNAVFEAVPPGAWVAHAWVRLAGGTIVPVSERRIELVEGSTVSKTLSLKALIYRGRVERSGEPLDGVLWLAATERGMPSQSATVEKGKFAILLEHGGKFKADLQTWDRRRIAIATPVVFTKADEEVVIRVGDARISGRVETSSGQPAPSIRVSATQTRDGGAAGEAQAVTREDGTFDIESLEAGTWKVYAWATSQRSEAVMVAVAPRQTTSGVQLRLAPLTTIRGRIRDAGGAPVAGAIVIAHDFAAPDAQPMFAHASDAGEFSFELTRSEPFFANLTVLSPDGSVSTRRAELRDGMSIVLPAQYASIRIRHSDGPWKDPAMRGHFLVADDGSWVPLATAGKMNGDTVVVPRIATGHWRFIVADDVQRSLVRAGRADLIPPITSFFAEPNGLAEITWKEK